MLFSTDDAEQIINNSKNLVNQFERDENNHQIIIKNKYASRDRSDKEDLTTPERVLIGALARAGLGTQSDIGKEFGVSSQQVSRLSMGMVNATSHPRFKAHPELEEKIPDKLSEIEEKATNVLLSALGVITPEKLDKVNVKTASSVAANASRIISNIRPQNVEDNRIQVVMYAPRQKELNDFDVVEL